ncbi:hypothetical protein K2Z84_04555, partial [Candidatus Binatia bacterium]|nr:hypothetical protein [Candidatus Binatia bacterium]
MPDHYVAIGENLLAVLQEIAGDAWAPPVAQAWADAYGVIQTAMIRPRWRRTRRRAADACRATPAPRGASARSRVPDVARRTARQA